MTVPKAESRGWETSAGALAADEVQLWRLPLDLATEVYEPLARTLSEDEQERAARLRFERDRRRWIAGRGLLRTILGQYVAAEPAQLVFEYGVHGKPELTRPRPGQAVSFSLAHSDDLALLAVSRRDELGIDLERVRPVAEAQRIVESFFTERERTIFGDLVPERRLEVFFRWWVRKEALVKAIGGGLTLPLNQLEVSLGPAEPVACADGGADSLWRLHDLPLSGHAAALATPDRDLQLTWQRWQGQ